MKKLIALLAAVLMIVSVTGCQKKPQEEETVVDNSNRYTIKVTGDSAVENTYQVASETEVLSALLEEIAKINVLSYESAKGENGWYLSSVNGEEAGEDNWTVYLNGQLCTDGIDKITLKDGDVIEIVRIKAVAQPETVPVLGGWETFETIHEELADDEKEIFANGLKGLTGVGYEPVRVLAKQVVSGTNNAFLAKGTLVTAAPETDYYIVTVYTDLEGKSEFKAINKIDIANLETTTTKNEQLLGGWTVISGGKPGYFSDEKIMNSFEKAVKDEKMVFSPIQLLATQPVSGTNYLALCFGKDADGNADLYFVKWYEDLQGNSKLESCDICNLQYYITGE